MGQHEHPTHQAWNIDKIDCKKNREMCGPLTHCLLYCCMYQAIELRPSNVWFFFNVADKTVVTYFRYVDTLIPKYWHSHSWQHITVRLRCVVVNESVPESSMIESNVTPWMDRLHFHRALCLDVIYIYQSLLLSRASHIHGTIEDTLPGFDIFNTTSVHLWMIDAIQQVMSWV